MTRAIEAGDSPFQGMVPAVLDQIFEELSASIDRSPETLRELYFLTSHGHFTRSLEEMNKILFQLGPFQREIVSRLRGGPESFKQPYCPNRQMLFDAVQSALVTNPRIKLLEHLAPGNAVFFRFGPASGSSIEVCLNTRLNPLGTYSQDVLRDSQTGTRLNCMLRPLFGDFRDSSYHCPDDVQRWTVDILRYASAVFEWWETDQNENPSVP
ncbi:hypothetical protein [Donghicola mangrovi]|uniref:Uncharacterized protein n=1 Tax=Donghicola mangrovi TaxID=2729614 RepID=A0A850QAZ2_9RHOB|nr:hypothetical protein [Donghicola mangrovi]NVO25502.1 hypothetical protein [Donghicola mangrovi]